MTVNSASYGSTSVMGSCLGNAQSFCSGQTSCSLSFSIGNCGDTAPGFAKTGSLVISCSSAPAKCGTANGHAVSASPAANLCAIGTASAVTGSGPWTWSCMANDSGVTAICAAPLFAQPTGATLTAETGSANNSTFVLGTNVQLTFSMTKMVPSQPNLLALNILDENGNTRAAVALPVTADSSGRASVIYNAPASKLGYYRVNAAMADGTTLSRLGTRPAGFITYAVVPDPNTRVDYGDAGSRFGLQGGFSAQQGSVLAYLGVRYVLASVSSWHILESNYAGQFAAERAAALAKGQVYPAKNPVISNTSYGGKAWPTYSVPTVLGAGLPSWAVDPSTIGTSCKTFSALNPAGVSAYPNFVQTLATEVASDYSSQSNHYYQINWEPESPWCYGGTSQQLVQYYQLSYSAIHQADPKALVMGPTLFPSSTSQLSSLFSAGLGSFVDAISMHPYVSWPPESNGLVTSLRTQMQMAAKSIGRSVPFVGTEHGFTSGTIGDLNHALGNVRSTIILLGEGFKFALGFYIADFWDNTPTDLNNTYGFYWNLNPNINFGTDKLGPKPTVPAYAAMSLFLDGTTSNGVLSNVNGTQIGYRFKRNGTTILALWDYMGTSTVNLTTPVGGNLQICDWMGNCNTQNSTGSLSVNVGAAPIYIIGQGL